MTTPRRKPAAPEQSGELDDLARWLASAPLPPSYRVNSAVVVTNAEQNRRYYLDRIADGPVGLMRRLILDRLRTLRRTFR